MPTKRKPKTPHTLHLTTSELQILDNLLLDHILVGTYWGNREKHYLACQVLAKKLDSAYLRPEKSPKKSAI